MDLGPAGCKIYRIRLGFVGLNYTGGFWKQMHSRRCTVKAKGRKALTTMWPSSLSQMSAPGSWAVICSDRFGAHGTAIRGKGGGATILRTTHLFLCSHITLG